MRSEYLIAPSVVSTIQRYKICKQFTTAAIAGATEATLFLLSKDTRFVSNSQRSWIITPRCGCCFYYPKIQDL